MEREHKIYVLVDPREPEHIRYVGYTSYSLEIRLRRHITESTKCLSHKNNWINSLVSQYINPNIKLYKVVSEETWSKEEQDAITYFESCNHKLTNATLGGEGCISSLETRARQSKSAIKRWSNLENRNKLKITLTSPMSRVASSKRSTELWRNEDYRRKNISAQKSSEARKNYIKSRDVIECTRNAVIAMNSHQSVEKRKATRKTLESAIKYTEGRTMGTELARQQMILHKERLKTGWYDAQRTARLASI